jgi:hypothetical protein
MKRIFTNLQNDLADLVEGEGQAPSVLLKSVLIRRIRFDPWSSSFG